MTPAAGVLTPLSLADLKHVRSWRNDPAVRGTLRTPFMLTEEQMAEFYREVVCDRRSPHRYWGIHEGHPVDGAGSLVAMVGLTNIEWENGLAEISLIVHPMRRDHGLGATVVDLALEEAFHRLGLKTVWGECYKNNPAVAFWERITARYGGVAITIPRRKFWDGQLWDALHFTIARERSLTTP